MKLYDSPFSPFARKVWMVLRWKGLAFEAVDALRPEMRAALAAVNPRVEVPVLEDGDLRVVNSADIVAYLDQRYPERPVYPADARARVAARAWERVADTTLDAILHDLSIWTWPIVERTDSEPAGLRDAARADLEDVFGQLEGALGAEGFLCGEPSIAELALFPHLVACRPLGIPFEAERFPRLHAWFRRVRALPVCVEDVARARAWLAEATRTGLKADKIVWRGERVEWLLAHGFHDWFFGEIRAGRAGWPRR